MAGEEAQGSTFRSARQLGERVVIDGDRSLVATATGFQFRLERAPLVEVQYIHNGEGKSLWVEEWRLSLAKDLKEI